MYERDDKKSFKSRVDYSYDALNRITRKVGIENIGDSQDYVDTLRFFNDKIEYKYSALTKTCTKGLINFDWKDFGNKFEYHSENKCVMIKLKKRYPTRCTILG